MMNGHHPGGDEHRLGPRAFWLRPGVVAGAAAAALDVGWVLDARAGGFSSRDVFVAVVLASAALSAVVGSAIEVTRVRGVALGWSAAILLSVGALSLGSVGGPLLVAGGLAAAAMLGAVGHGPGRRTVLAVTVSLLAAFAVVFVGVLATR